MECTTSAEGNNLLNDDPAAQLAFIDEYVKIILIKNRSFEGFVHSIDPVTRSVILFVPQADVHQIILIPGLSIINVLSIPCPPDLTPYVRKQDLPTSNEDIIDRKTKLIAWLKHNLLSVTEMDEKVVIGNVSILPPYSVTDICTDTPIVATQIRKIIGEMPSNYEPHKKDLK